MSRIYSILLFLFLSTSAVLFYPAVTWAGEPQEKSVLEIHIEGPLNRRTSEVSGMAWYKDNLLMAPQLPTQVLLTPPNRPAFYYLTKNQIVSYLEKSARGQAVKPLTPIAVPLRVEPALIEKLEGFEGFEAIAFAGERVFLSSEAKISSNHMISYLLAGKISPDLGHITLDNPVKPVRIQAQAWLPNSSYETLLVTPTEVLAVYEGNGKNINVSPLAYVYDHQLNFIRAVAFPNIEYRITDAAALKDGRFWCINYNYPGSKYYLPAEDPIAKTFGRGKTHRLTPVVERLVEFQYTGSRVTILNRPPIQLELTGKKNKNARNWEGIVRLEHAGFNGFLVITDEFPRTILGFVAGGE